MKSCIKLIASIVSIGACLLASPHLSIAWLRQHSCPDISERGHINVLTVNLLSSEFADRETRLQNLVGYVAQQSGQGEPIDIILLQEVVGGTLSGTQSSSEDLREMLAESGAHYNLQNVVANRIPGIITVANAILSRCRIVFTLAITLPSALEELSEDFGLPLSRKAMMSRIGIPGFGKIDVYNTHLCAFCDQDERLRQTQALLEFISSVERIIWWCKDPIILGGDLNIDLNIAGNNSTYDKIISFGFSDTYSAANACYSCCSEEEGYRGCTYGVQHNPYSEDTARIDYIFIKGMYVIESEVVFNSDPYWVSDHSGLHTRISLD